MFTAARLIAVFAIVSLSAGALLFSAGEGPTPAPTSPPPPTTDPLSSMVTEEVEPGVFRVDSDGIRPLSRPMSAAREPSDIHKGMEGKVVAGLDGSVWWFSQDGFFRLGDPDVHAWPDGRQDTFQYGMTTDLEVGPDGTVWLARGSRWAYGGQISSFVGEAWSVHQELSGSQTVLGVEILPDGDVWAAWVTEASPDQRVGEVTVAQLGDAGWEPLPGAGPRGDAGGDLLVSEAGGGAVWLKPDEGRWRLRRHDGNDWRVVMTPDAGGELRADAAPDGTLWVGLSTECGPGTPGNITFDLETEEGEFCYGASDLLARFDGTDWEVFDASDGIPRTGDHWRLFWGFFEAGPDGSLWFDPTVAREEMVDSDCDGVANFDGETVRRYLRGMCIYAMDVAPDGAVWLQGAQPAYDEPPPIDTYVITTEAVASTE